MALISKEELEELYWGEPGTEMGTTLIARKLNCSKMTVYNYLKKYNIKIRKPKNSRTLKGVGETKKKTEGISKPKIKLEECLRIYEEYKNSRKSQNRIAKEYKIHSDTVHKIVNHKHWSTRHLKEGACK